MSVSFYATHPTTICPDCYHPCDGAPEFGDHGGECADAPPPPGRRVMSGLEVIRRHALTHRYLSINTVRDEMVAAGVPETRRGPAFAAACRRRVIAPVGHEPSTGATAKGHDVKQYTSLICNRPTVEETNP